MYRYMYIITLTFPLPHWPEPLGGEGLRKQIDRQSLIDMCSVIKYYADTREAKVKLVKVNRKALSNTLLLI